MLIPATKTHPIGFLPLLRRGDLLFNAIVLAQRILNGESRRTATEHVRGHCNGSRAVLLADLVEGGPRVFGRPNMQMEILLSHTPLGVYGRAVSHHCASAWPSLQTERSLRQIKSTLGVTSPSAYLKLCSSALRSCRMCVQEDLDERGFAAWRVLHQIAAIDRCPKHGEQLIPEFAISSTLSGGFRQFGMPGEGELRTNLPPVAPLKLSEGYAGYLSLWTRLFDGELQIITPEYWLDVVTLVIGKSSIDAAARRLQRHIERTWECPLPDIAHLLKLGDAESIIKDELWLKSKPIDVARRILIYSAAIDHGLVDDTSMQLNLHYGPRELRIAEVLEPICETELRRNVLSKGLPLALCGAMLKFKKRQAAAGFAGLGPQTLGKFIRGLPLELLHDILSRFRDLQESSWVTTELHRRSCTDRAEVCWA